MSGSVTFCYRSGQSFFAYYFLKLHLHRSSKIKNKIRCHKTVEIKFIVLYGRIRETHKLIDPRDPDQEYCFYDESFPFYVTVVSAFCCKVFKILRILFKLLQRIRNQREKFLCYI